LDCGLYSDHGELGAGDPQFNPARLSKRLVSHDAEAEFFGEEQRKGNVVEASYRQIPECIGVSKSSAQAAVAWLIKRKLLASTKKTVTATPSYKVLTPWRNR
jgi:hypothetical protein